MKTYSILVLFLVLLMITISIGCISQSEQKQSDSTDLTEEPTKQPTSGSSVEQIKASAIAIASARDFDNLVRNNEQYVGKIVYFDGRVIGSEENNGKFRFWIRHDETSGGLPAPRYVVNFQGKRYLYDDNLRVWGTVKGFYDGSSLSAYTPEIDALIIE